MRKEEKSFKQLSKEIQQTAKDDRSNDMLALPSEWEDEFQEFYHLYVKADPPYHHAIMSGPNGVSICLTKYQTVREAKKRCYGLIRQEIAKWDQELWQLMQKC